MAQNIQRFFREIEAVWEAIPGYVKVFIYSVISSTAGLLIDETFTWKAVLIIVLINLGIYQAPRSINRGVQKLT